MKALFIAPLPPPFTGNSLPIQVLYEELKDFNDITVINLNKDKHKAGITSISRIIEIIGVLYKVRKCVMENDIIYLTVAESFAGNIRDIFIYFLCRKKLDRTVIHMLGGAAMKDILKPRNSLIFKINKYFISKLKGVVVEGETQFDTFSNVISNEKIHIVNNFAEDYLFISDDTLRNKFLKMECLNILFLSNLLPGKGYLELLEAYISLPDEYKHKIKIDFAGKLVRESDKKDFLEKLENLSNVKYHGTVSGDKKRDLFHHAHVFCLPTYYPYEGQPFTILEAYAGGNYVITTYHSGINHVFGDKINGTKVEKKSIESINDALIDIYNNKEDLIRIATYNRSIAKKEYTSRIYIDKMTKILLE